MQITDATLKALPGFRDLDRETFGAVEAISRLIEVPGKAVLCRQGGPPDALHYLLDGQVTMTQAAANGDVAVIDVVRPVRGIALANVVTGLTHQMTARALTMSRLLEIRAEPLRTLIGLRPSLATTMLQGLSLDLDTVTRHVIDLKLRSAAQRLGCYLLRLVHDVEDNRAEFRLPVRKRLLAGQIGCRHENLSRAFAVLRDLGVETHGGRVILHDIDRLHRYSIPNDPMPESAAAADLPRSVQAFSEAFNLR
ncbi:MAG: cyclic nucleotide-binding domain-containing protein [Acetobacteraceae bacterium]|jgi:CRP/FNR family transcriptional activator FtrB